MSLKNIGYTHGGFDQVLRQSTMITIARQIKFWIYDLIEKNQDMKKIKLLILLPILFLTISFIQVQVFEDAEKAGNTQEEQYYGIKDFGAVKKFDFHIHINTEETSFIEQALADNFRFLDIVDDRPFGLPMDGQQKIALLDLKKFSKSMAFATTFPVKGFSDKDWSEKTIAGLNKSFSDGAIAVKIWKNIGMDLKDESGKFVMVDDPGLEPILESSDSKPYSLIRPQR